MSSEESKRKADPPETPDQEKRQRTSDSDEEKKEQPETSQSISIDTIELAKDWTHDRHQRSTKKIRPSPDGKLRGGDFVFNKEGDCVTVAVFFEVDSKTYGITVGHFQADRVYKFEKYDEEDSTKILASPLGKHVSVDITTTDSLVFEVDDDKKEMVDVLRLVPKAGLGDRLVQLGLNPTNTAPPEQGTHVIIYGAMRRGAFGKVVVPSSEFEGDYSKVGDIGVRPDESNTSGLHNGGSNSITMGGDCGALYLDMKGNILGMHHVLAEPNAGGKGISYAVPWRRIVQAHPLLARYASSPETSDETQQRMRPQEAPMELKGGYKETLDIAKFDIKIIGREEDDTGVVEDLQIGKAKIEIIR